MRPPGRRLAFAPHAVVLITVHGFVAAVLAGLAALLLIAGRRGSASVLLSIFLCLVALNFVAVSVYLASGSTEDMRLMRVANLALALDPLYLFAFAAAYPYRRRTPAIRAILSVLACFSLAGIVLTLLDPTPTFSPPDPAQIVIIVGLVIGYLGAFFVALGTLLEAPTLLLTKRAGRLLAAVGIATIPRVGITPTDFGLSYVHPAAARLAKIIVGDPNWGHFFLLIIVQLAVGAVILTIGYLLARARPARMTDYAYAAKIIALALGIVAIGELAWLWLDSLPGIALGLNPYLFRWIVFAAILVYGILRYEVEEFTLDAVRVAAWSGAAFGSLATFSFAAIGLSVAGLSNPIVFGLAIALALGNVMPSAALGRAIATRIGVQRGAETLAPIARRLELYRAALESAYARGEPEPSSRRALERDRKAFGVSVEEGRALEHVVALRLARAPRPLDDGEEVLPGVVIERELGRGAHGRALLARRVTTGEALVVKESSASGGDAALKEALVLRRLQHPGIVPLLDLHVREGRVYLLSPHVEGEPLSARLEAGPVGATVALRIAQETLAALAAAHAAGVVHRDVKPSNILLRPDGSIALIDFGVATIRDEETLGGTIGNISGLDAFVGTLRYMSPEQAGGAPVGRRADLYSLGLVLAECLTGRPARDLAGATGAAAVRIVASGAVDLSRVDPAWREFLARATAPDPADRFADANEMARALPAPAANERSPLS